MSVQYCLLDQAEAARFENWGIWPCCRKSHIHIKRTAALAMVAEETHRLVGGADTSVPGDVTMIVPIATDKMWAPVRTSMADGTRLMGMRTWGLARTK